LRIRAASTPHAQAKITLCR